MLEEDLTGQLELLLSVQTAQMVSDSMSPIQFQAHLTNEPDYMGFGQLESFQVLISKPGSKSL
jgi:hypothetical protein